MNCLFHVLTNLHAPSRRIMQGLDQTRLKTTAKLGTGGILIKKSSRFTFMEGVKHFTELPVPYTYSLS